MNPDASVVRATEETADGVRLELVGEVDVTHSPGLRRTLFEVTDGKPSLVRIDLHEVQYMDSSGVAVLVEALQRQRRHGGSLELHGLNDRVRSIFEIARLDTVFTIVDPPTGAGDTA